MSSATLPPEWQSSGLFIVAAALMWLVAEAVQAWTAWCARRRLLRGEARRNDPTSP